MSVVTYGELVSEAITRSAAGTHRLVDERAIGVSEQTHTDYFELLAAIHDGVHTLTGIHGSLDPQKVRGGDLAIAHVQWALFAVRGTAGRTAPSAKAKGIGTDFERASRLLRASSDLVRTHGAFGARALYPYAAVLRNDDARRVAARDLIGIAQMLTQAGNCVVEVSEAWRPNTRLENLQTAHFFAAIVGAGEDSRVEGRRPLDALRPAKCYELDALDPVVKLTEWLTLSRDRLAGWEVGSRSSDQVTRDAAVLLAGAHGLLAQSIGGAPSRGNVDMRVYDASATSYDASRGWAGVRSAWSHVVSPHPRDRTFSMAASNTLQAGASLRQSQLPVSGAENLELAALVAQIARSVQRLSIDQARDPLLLSPGRPLALDGISARLDRAATARREGLSPTERATRESLIRVVQRAAITSDSVLERLQGQTPRDTNSRSPRARFPMRTIGSGRQL